MASEMGIPARGAEMGLDLVVYQPGRGHVPREIATTWEGVFPSADLRAVVHVCLYLFVERKRGGSPSMRVRLTLTKWHEVCKSSSILSDWPVLDRSFCFHDTRLAHQPDGRRTGAGGQLMLARWPWMYLSSGQLATLGSVWHPVLPLFL